jgi:hypothetical protein
VRVRASREKLLTRRPQGGGAQVDLWVYPLGARLARTALACYAERRWGWHLWVEAAKDGQSASYSSSLKWPAGYPGA